MVSETGTHGNYPGCHEHIEKVIGMYDKMSKYETEPGLVICYGTMYGNTERMAEIIVSVRQVACRMTALWVVNCFYRGIKCATCGILQVPYE